MRGAAVSGVSRGCPLLPQREKVAPRTARASPPPSRGKAAAEPYTTAASNRARGLNAATSPIVSHLRPRTRLDRSPCETIDDDQFTDFGIEIEMDYFALRAKRRRDRDAHEGSVMSENAFETVVIGSGLGGLTAAALLAKSGRKVCVIERNHSVGGAASAFKTGALTIEPALHQTADPHDPSEPKHAILTELGLLDEIEWIRVDPFFSVKGGPVGDIFDLPVGFDAAREALSRRFPRSRDGFARLLGAMEEIHSGVASLTKAGRVGVWRGGFRLSMSVAAPFVWRCLSGSTVAPFPHPPHRTGQADFLHPALGQDLTPSSTARRAQAGSDVRARSARKGARVDSSRPLVA